MANQTLTAASNFDGPALMLGLLNGEAITVNGGALTIDSDVRWNQNAAVFGGITVSATLGGAVLFEGRNVWELPYTAATGNVPAQAALGSNGVTGGTSSATGELLRVWATGSLAPAAAGGAMPATGWVKLRSKSGTFTGGEAVTLPGGATITISGPGKRSWLHIVGAELGALTWARLGDVKWRGEWHELGTTNGADDQTFQFPVADLCPAVWVEKYPGSYSVLGESGLESWLNAGPRWGAATQQVALDLRGKYFGQVAATGVITIALRAANPCGFKPEAGLKVFVPNLILSCANSTNWALNTVHATQATRYEISTTQGAVVDMQGCSAIWYLNAVSASGVTLRRTGALDGIVLSNTSTAPVLEDFSVGLSASTTGYAPATLTSIYYGMTMTRVRLARVVQGTFAVWTDVYGLNWTDVQLECFGAAGSVARSSAAQLVARRVSRGTASAFRLLGVSASLEACADLEILDAEYADNMAGTTGTAVPQSPFTPNAGAKSVHIRGFKSFGDLPNVHPYSQIISATAGATDTVLSDVGTPAAPYNCGSANAMGSALGASGVLDVTLRRVYLSNNRLEPVTMANTVDTVSLINVWGSTTASQIFDANTVTAKGCKWSLTTAAQSAVYGTHWQDQFTGDTTGAITIFCNEPSEASAADVTTSIAGGSSGWTAAGSIVLPDVGDSVTWTMPYYALGHTSLSSSDPVVMGTNAANHLVEFQADTGGGFGPWADMTGVNLAAVGAIDPTTGVKLKVRATVTVAAAGNALTYLRIYTATDTVSQQTQYPLPGVLTTVIAQTPLTGAEVRVYDLDNLPAGSLGAELAGTESAGASFTFDAQAGNSVWLQVMAPGFEEYGQQLTVPDLNTTLSVILQPELNN